MLLPFALLFGTGLAAQNTNDAKILDYKGLDYLCSGGVTPVLQIKNMGSEAMVGCVVETWKNGLQLGSFNWILAIPMLQDEFRKPALPPVSDVLPSDVLEFRIISVNGIPDQDPDGNVFQKSLDKVPVTSPQQTVSVRILTGPDAGSVTWEIHNALDAIVASGGPYEVANTVINETAVLPGGSCFTFKAKDPEREVVSSARVELLSGTNTLIVSQGADLSAGYSKGLTIGNNEPCTENISVSLNTDGAPAETTWEVIDQLSDDVVCVGIGNYAVGASVTENCCLPVGCYRLRVMDAGGDGITGGGYVVHEQSSNARIVDNRSNFSTGSISAISGAQGFCLPIGTDALITSSCDKLEWLNYRYLVAHENAAVSATWVPNGANNVQPANSGYEFWIFDPNGTYSFRKFRSHNVSDGFSPASATRAAHMKINGWYNTVLTPLIPQQTLLNVRLRGRVNGENGVFGPACTMKLDAARAACPLNRLLVAPGDSRNSCGVTKTFGSGSYVYATPFSGVPSVPSSQLRYQFRFRYAPENFEVIRTSNTYILPLYWTGAGALQCGIEYTVDVRVSKDGGATWCTDTPTPTVPFQAWGEVCSLTIAPCVNGGGPGASSVLGERAMQFTLYPNPLNGDLLFVQVPVQENAQGSGLATIMDPTGRIVAERNIVLSNGTSSTLLDLGDLVNGTYFLKLTIGKEVGVERFVVQR